MTSPLARLPDPASVEAVLKFLDSASALSAAFSGFTFMAAPVDDFCWRSSGRTVIDAGGARLGRLIVQAVRLLQSQES